MNNEEEIKFYNRCVEIADKIIRNKGGKYDDIHEEAASQGIKLDRAACMEIGKAELLGQLH